MTGKLETSRLKENLEDQLGRLMQQMADLEENRADLEDDEYEETKQETIEQLEEFHKTLGELVKGDLSLVDELSGMQLAIQAAISDAFHTPEIIKLFARKQPGQLRQRLAQVERDKTIKRISPESADQQKVEILTALKKLGDTLSPEEDAFLTSKSSTNIKEFQQVTDNLVANDDQLKALNRDQLIKRVIQLESHVTQLRTIIAKKTDTQVQPQTTSSDGFDFSRYNIRHVLLKVCYLGWRFHGFVTQEDCAETIEHYLFDALLTTKLIESRNSSNYNRCGRTDKGVSAFCQTISITVRSQVAEGKGVIVNRSASKVGTNGEISYCNALNHVLPDEIRVIAWSPVECGFSARFHCLSRTYRYFFPLGDLDLERMNTAAGHLLGEHDFRNFCKMDVAGGVDHFVRRIDVANLHVLDCSQAGVTPYTICVFEVTGQAFLWHQIRCIVALLVLVGLGKEKSDITKELLDIERYPCKPQYEMASEIPLVLYDCRFPDDEVDWRIDEKSTLDAVKHFQKLWAEQKVKSEMLQLLVGDLQRSLPSAREVKSQCDLILPQPKKHRPLLKRQTGQSLETKLLIKKRKLDANESPGNM